MPSLLQVCAKLRSQSHHGKGRSCGDYAGQLCLMRRCLQICPQSAKTLVSDLSMVKDMIEAGEKVVVSLAPSYMGLLKFHTIGQVRCALMRLGFADVRETSEGAAHGDSGVREASFGRNHGKHYQHLLPQCECTD